MSDKAVAKRRPRAELRHLMVQAGVETFLQLDPSIGGERVNYANVFRHLEETTGIRVTYGSVHERIWDSQRDFQIEIIRTVASRLVTDSLEIAEQSAIKAVEDEDLSTLTGRRIATQNLVRTIADVHLATMLDSPLVRMKIAIEHRFASVAEDNPERDLVEEAIVEGYTQTRDYCERAITGLIDLIGLQPSSQLMDTDSDEAVTGVINLVRPFIDGILVQSSIVGEQNVKLNTGPNGEPENWSTAALGMWAAVRTMLELSGDESPELRQL